MIIISILAFLTLIIGTSTNIKVIEYTEEQKQKIIADEKEVDSILKELNKPNITTEELKELGNRLDQLKESRNKE